MRSEAHRGFRRSVPATFKSCDVKSCDVSSSDSAERVAAGAGTRGVRVVDGEALLLDGVDEVDGGTAEVRQTHPVDYEVEAAPVGAVVPVELALVEEQLVPQARAAAGLNGDPQRQVVATFLVEQGLDLQRGRLRED